MTQNSELIGGVNEPSLELYKLMAETVRDYAIFFLDPQGRVASWNPGAQAIKQYAPHEIIGQHFSRFYEQSDIEKDWPEHELKVASESGRFEDEGWRVRKDGTRFWANVIITALKDHAGNLLAFTKITRDLTERRRYEETLRQSEERFRLLVEGVEDYAIFMLDPDGIVSSWNSGARQITGYESPEIVGRHFSAFFPEDDVKEGKPTRELDLAKIMGRVEDEGWRCRKDGTRFWARAVITALHDLSGNLRGFAKVTQDLTPRKHAESLEATTRHLNEFIAILAHELRNPLAPIRSAIDVMKMGQMVGPDVRDMLQIVDRQSGQLMRIVEDILDVSRITRGNFSINIAPTQVFQLITRAIEAAKPGIIAKDHRLTLDLVHAPDSVIVDEQRLAQALTNLLNNAVRYTDPGGEIVLRAHAEYSANASDLVICVRDNGIGIEPEFLPLIFGMFVQENRERVVSGRGLGVGLALVKSIVEMHGGSISVRSEGRGKGSEFIIRIPIGGANGKPASETTNVDSTLDNLRILVVDDNKDAAATLSAFLRGNKHHVLVANSGPDALEMFKTHAPELILLDIGMPGMNGRDLTRRIRAEPGGEKVYIVAVTGWGKAEDVQLSADAGIDLHLVKPVPAEQLLTLLRSQTKRAKEGGA